MKLFSAKGGRQKGTEDAEIGSNLSQGRINEARFAEFPIEHRNTFVTGMSDMIEGLAKYLDAKTLSAFQPMLDYQRTLVSEDLRQEFDSYLASDSCPTCGIASAFISFLVEKSGADQQIPK